jgi:hypothetical protein
MLLDPREVRVRFVGHSRLKLRYAVQHIDGCCTRLLILLHPVRRCINFVCEWPVKRDDLSGEHVTKAGPSWAYPCSVDTMMIVVLADSKRVGRCWLDCGGQLLALCCMRCGWARETLTLVRYPHGSLCPLLECIAGKLRYARCGASGPNKS